MGKAVDLNQRLSVSYYKTIAAINESHKIDLVRHQETGKIYVKKTLDVYSIDVYKYLKEHHITGIPEIIEYFEDDGTLILIEEYVSGTTLREMIESHRLSPHSIVRYLTDLCGILEKLHSHKPPMVHRDIKPSNIIITSYDNVFLLDFNAAKYRSVEQNRSSDTVLLGTQGYAAPEQYGFGESSPQTDIYSIGIVLREMVNSLSDRDSSFDAVISKCTQMDPKKRYRSVRDLQNALRKLMDKEADLRPESNTVTTFLPPGFRTMTPGKMAIAIPTYAVVFALCLSFDVRNTFGAALWLIRIGFLLIALGDIFIGYNYLGVQRFFPPCRSRNPYLRIFGILLFCGFFSVLSFVLLIFMRMILFPS